MIKIEKRECYGCGACVAACPIKCIEMLEDREGFLYPHVQEEMCIFCKRCVKVCPSLSKNKKGLLARDYHIITVGGTSKDNSILKNSSSGGAFTLFAKEIIKRGGMVYGCAWDNHLMPVHVGISKAQDIDKLRGAKYVQSVLENTFNEIEEILNEEKEVLFIGTPCECAGLNTYLGKVCKNLYLCDFVCHGVPSRGVFRNWKNYQEHKYQDKIINSNFPH